MDPITRTGYEMRDYSSYSSSIYSKPPLVLDQLEAMVGRPLMEQAMQGFAKEMAFKHPSCNDFKRIFEKTTYRDLNAFWSNYLEGTDTLDYIISNVEILDIMEGGWLEGPRGPIFATVRNMAPGLKGHIILERRGSIRVPVTIWVRLSDKSEQRLLWDGQDRWVSFEFHSPITAAVLDPDGNYPMLKDRLHSAYVQKPVKRGFHYWSQMLWGSLTGLLQGIGLA